MYAKSFNADKRAKNIGVLYSQDFRKWLQIHHVKGIFTEVGVPGNDPQWLASFDMFLFSINTDPNIVGATYWSAGPWWGSYPLSIEPIMGQDRPQMQILEKYMH